MVYYYYFFYKIYRFFKFVEPSSEDDKLIKGKSSVVSGILLSINWLSIVFYKDAISGNHEKYTFLSYKMGLPILLVPILHWFLFGRNDKWKEYVNRFDKWPKAKNELGSWVVAGIVILVFINLGLSIHFLPIIDSVDQQ
jgi:hypothetical protein